MAKNESVVKVFDSTGKSKAETISSFQDWIKLSNVDFSEWSRENSYPLMKVNRELFTDVNTTKYDYLIFPFQSDSSNGMYLMLGENFYSTQMPFKNSNFVSVKLKNVNSFYSKILYYNWNLNHLVYYNGFNKTYLTNTHTGENKFLFEIKIKPLTSAFCIDKSNSTIFLFISGQKDGNIEVSKGQIFEK